MKQHTLLTLFVLLLLATQSLSLELRSQASANASTKTQSHINLKAKPDRKLPESLEDSFETPGLPKKMSISDYLKQPTQTKKSQTKVGVNDGAMPEQETDHEAAQETEQEEEQEEEAGKGKPDKIFAKGWMSINSKSLSNPNMFPDLSTPQGDLGVSVDAHHNRLNAEFFKKGSGIPSKFSFYFRVSRYYLYYANKPSDINVLASLPVRSVIDAYVLRDKPSCFRLKLKNNSTWTLCGKTLQQTLKFLCPIQRNSKNVEPEGRCKKRGAKMDASKIGVRTVTQPFIIIPMPSKNCNQEWNYNRKGSDWNCDCKEGKEQSPIDLPPKKEAVDSPYKPIFEYEVVQPTIPSAFPEANISAGDKIQVRYEEFAIRIKHPSFGRVITPDGGVFSAQEIVFHTPSEHTIAGKRVDMEMQVIHTGVSKGDIAKHLVVSFLFTRKPGAFNKFFDKMNIYNMPNPAERFREVTENLFIPYVFQNSSDPDMTILEPFSFYTYQGSLTAPPCLERTIHYVSADPIPVSNTVVTLLEEALRPPTVQDSSGNIQIDTKEYKNYRVKQPLNGRPVFLYDHKKYNCPSFIKHERKPSNSGHYEKVIKESTKYMFVPGFKPSGMPGAIVVPVTEATGKAS